MLLRISLISSLFFTVALAQLDFRQQVAQALAKGETKIVIAPGSYRLAPEDGQKSVWTLRNLKNVEIIADGVTLVSTKLTRAVDIGACSGLTLRGLTVDYDPLPFTQGTVTAVAEDWGWIDVKLHAGYPRQAYARIDVVDAKTRHRKKGIPFLWGTKAEMHGNDVVRIVLKDIGKTAEVGDLASLNTGPAADGIPHALSIENCSAVSLRGVTIQSAPGMGILECDGDGKSEYLGCKVIPGPKPPGATQERLLSSSWDAMQSKTVRQGSRVEGCEIRAAGDDSWSVQSSDFLVVAKNGSTAVLAFRDPYCSGPLVGDRLASSLDSVRPVIATRKSVELKPPFVTAEMEAQLKNAPKWSKWEAGSKAIEITISGDFPFDVGDSVYCPDRQGNGFVFRNNKLHSSGRILIKAGDGLIENNTIIGGHSGVTVCPEVIDGGAFGIRNITIRCNRFASTGYFCPSWWNTQAGAISITASAAGKAFCPAGAFQNIAIESNRFEDINSASIVVTSTKGLKIFGNTFDKVMTAKPNDSGGSYGIDGKSLVWLANDADVTVGGNKVTAPGEFLQQTISGKDLAPEVLEAMKGGIK